MFYPPSEQCSLHSSCLFLLFSLKLLTIAAYYVSVLSCFVCLSNQKLTFGNQQKVPSNQQRSSLCTICNTDSTALLVLIWYSPGSHASNLKNIQKNRKFYMGNTLLLRQEKTTFTFWKDWETTIKKHNQHCSNNSSLLRCLSFLL